MTDKKTPDEVLMDFDLKPDFKLNNREAYVLAEALREAINQRDEVDKDRNRSSGQLYRLIHDHDDLKTDYAKLEEEVKVGRERLGPAGWKLLQELTLLRTAHARLKSAVLDVIELDRFCGDGPTDQGRAIELKEGDSVIVADLLRGLGLPIKEYP